MSRPSTLDGRNRSGLILLITEETSNYTADVHAAPAMERNLQSATVAANSTTEARRRTWTQHRQPVDQQEHRIPSVSSIATGYFEARLLDGYWRRVV